MIVAALLAAPALAQPLPGSWLPVAAPQPRPAVIALHSCDRAMAELFRERGFHVLMCATDIHGALDWLAARPEVDRSRIVVLGWSETGSALLAALKHRIGPMPLQARAAIAFSPACAPYAVTPGSYLPVAPLLILVGASERTLAAPCLELANWTPKVMVRAVPENGDGIEAMLEFLERELR